MNELFSIERLWWLLRADFTSGYRSVLAVSATLAGVILVASLLSIGPAGAAQGFFVSWYGGMLYIWGVIASSRAFAELHDKTRNAAYLLIPASTIEKTLARLLAVTVGLTVYLLIFTTAVSLLVEGLYRLFVGASIGIFNPLDPEIRPLIAGYIFLQSFFFLGAAWFRRRHFIKTTLVITLAGIVLMLFALLVARVVFAPQGIADLANVVAGGGWILPEPVPVVRNSVDDLRDSFAGGVLVYRMATGPGDTSQRWNLASQKASTCRSRTRSATASCRASGSPGNGYRRFANWPSSWAVNPKYRHEELSDAAGLGHRRQSARTRLFRQRSGSRTGVDRNA